MALSSFSQTALAQSPGPLAGAPVPVAPAPQPSQTQPGQNAGSQVPVAQPPSVPPVSTSLPPAPAPGTPLTAESMTRKFLETLEEVQIEMINRYMRKDGLISLNNIMKDWAVQHPPIQGDIVNHRKERDEFADLAAFHLILDQIPKILAKIEENMAPHLANKDDASAIAAQAALKVLKNAMFKQRGFAEERVSSFIELLKQAQQKRDASGRPVPVEKTAESSESTASASAMIVQKNQGEIITKEIARASKFDIGELDIDPGLYDDVEAQKPSRLRAAGARAFGMGKEFATQSVLFNIPMGFVMIAQLGIDYSKDPLALEKFVKSLSDPATHLGFMAFMAANHKVTHWMQGVANGKIPPTMIPYIGMSAGLVASSIVGDFYHDKNVWKCAKGDKKACDSAYETWAIAGKINQYAPAILSLCSSTLFAAAIKGALVKSGELGGKFFKIVFRGMKIAPRVVGVAGRGIVNLLGPASSIGGNLIFLAADQILSPHVQPFLEKFATEKFSIYEFLNRHTYLSEIGDAGHLLFFGNINMPSVENVKTMDEALENLKATVTRADSTRWQEINAADCTKGKDVSILVANNSNVRECLFTASVPKSVEQYAKINKKWRDDLLSKPMASEQSWESAFHSFTVAYMGTAALYPYFIDSLYEKAHNGTTYNNKPIDLSQSALDAVLQEAVHIKPKSERTDEDNENLADLHPKSVGVVASPELLDYLVLGMACGPHKDDKPGVWQYFTSASWIPTKPSFLSFLPSIFSNMPTPMSPIVDSSVGYSPTFYPPNITTLDGSLCQYGPSSGKEGSGLRGGHNVPKNIFEDIWRSPNDPTKPYHGVLEVITDAIDPKILTTVDDQTPMSGALTFLNDYVVPPVTAAYKTFQGEYLEFLNRQLRPVLVSRKMRAYGKCFWNKKEDRTSDGSYDPRDKVSCGVYHSMELELRQYLYLIQKVYQSALPVAAKDQVAAAFKAPARAIIDLFRNETDWDHYEESFGVDGIKGPVKEVEDSLTQALAKPEDEYKKKTIDAIFKQINALLQERAEYAKMLTVLDPDKQSVDTPARSGARPTNRLTGGSN